MRALALETFTDIIVIAPQGLLLYPGVNFGTDTTCLKTAYPYEYQNVQYGLPKEAFMLGTFFLMSNGRSHYFSAFQQPPALTDSPQRSHPAKFCRIWDHENGCEWHSAAQAPATGVNAASPRGCPAARSDMHGSRGIASAAHAGSTENMASPGTTAMTAAAAGLLQIHGQVPAVQVERPQRKRKVPARYNTPGHVGS